MFKNRNIKTNFDFPSSLVLNYQIPEEVHHQSAHVALAKENPSPDSSKDANLRRNSSFVSCNAASFDKSSSSSVSWIEEDTEATKAVQGELSQMQKVLRGLEAIPTYYDRDEYELWIKTFPSLSLSVTGRKLRIPPAAKNLEKCSGYEEILVVDPSTTGNNDAAACDRVATSMELKTKLKSAVIQKIFSNVSSRLFKHDTHKQRGRNISAKSGKIPINGCKGTETQKNGSDEKLLSDLNSVLRISPVPLFKSPTEATLPNREISLLSRQFMTSKWLQDESPEYVSLPHLPPQDPPLSKNITSVSAKIQRLNHKPKNPKPGAAAQVHYVTLPPIEVSCQNAKGQFRSVSATPRCHSKSLSALTTSELGVCGHTPKHQRKRPRKVNRRTVNVNVDVLH